MSNINLPSAYLDHLPGREEHNLGLMFETWKDDNLYLPLQNLLA